MKKKMKKKKKNIKRGREGREGGERGEEGKGGREEEGRGARRRGVISLGSLSVRSFDSYETCIFFWGGGVIGATLPRRDVYYPALIR
jgi:hypothetical protein